MEYRLNYLVDYLSNCDLTIDICTINIARSTHISIADRAQALAAAPIGRHAAAACLPG